MREDFRDSVGSKVTFFKLTSFAFFTSEIFLQHKLIDLEIFRLGMLLVIVRLLLLLGHQYVLFSCL